MDVLPEPFNPNIRFLDGENWTSRSIKFLKPMICNRFVYKLD